MPSRKPPLKKAGPDPASQPPREFRTIPITSLLPDEKNPRKDLQPSDPEYQKIKTSIEQFQFLDPIVFNSRTLKVLGGHQRLKILKDTGVTDLFILSLGAYSWAFSQADLQELPPAMETAANIALNKASGDWDNEKLVDALNGIKLDGLDITITGFGEKELVTFMADLLKGEATEDEYEPPPDIITDIKRGDIFQLGLHRVMCGDSTSKEDVGRLMDGKKADMMVTDPPYGVEYDPEWRTHRDVAQITHGKKIENDDRADWFEAWELFGGDIAYIWHAGAHSPEVALSLERSGLIPTYLIIWNKDLAVFGRGDYPHKHEPCWYCIRKNAKHHWSGGRDQKTVWDIPTIHSFRNGHNAEEWDLVGHAAQKPVDCMTTPIKNHDCGTIYDPFLGSGTTLIACEQLGRICYGMEISPQYCEVICQRWEKLTGNKRVKVTE